jgi:hypothetical protein
MLFLEFRDVQFLRSQVLSHTFRDPNERIAVSITQHNVTQQDSDHFTTGYHKRIHDHFRYFESRRTDSRRTT